MLFHQRSYTLGWRPCFWIATCMWWCRPWREDDGSCLPHGLSVMNTYTKMTTGSKWVVVVVKNQTTALITITKGIKVTWVVAANVVPHVEVVPGTLEKPDEIQGVQRVKMLTGQGKGALFQQLDFSGLEGWSAENWAAACTLLVEYHDIFFGAWRVGLYQSGKAWDQGHWWWALQEEVPEHSPLYGGWGPCPCQGDVGSGCYSPIRPMV